MSVCMYVMYVSLSICMLRLSVSFKSACLPAHLQYVHVYLLVCHLVCLPIFAYVSLSVCLSICMFVCMSWYLFVCMSVCIFISLPLHVQIPACICLLVYLHVYLSASLSVCLFAYLSVCLCIDVCMSICLAVGLSVGLPDKKAYLIRFCQLSLDQVSFPILLIGIPNPKYRHRAHNPCSSYPPQGGIIPHPFPRPPPTK